MSGKTHQAVNDRYAKSIDGVPFMMYSTLAIVVIVMSVYVSQSLVIFSLIPMYMAMSIGSKTPLITLIVILSLLAVLALLILTKKSIQ
ncbi:hypothetical protein CWI40_121310 [Ordospora colligata]|nr:hypothetical protein CWI40_121310 [Ordospora colligata]